MGKLWARDKTTSGREGARAKLSLPSSWLGEVRVVKESSCPSVMDAGAGADGVGKMRVEEG